MDATRLARKGLDGTGQDKVTHTPRAATRIHSMRLLLVAHRDNDELSSDKGPLALKQQRQPGTGKASERLTRDKWRKSAQSKPSVQLGFSRINLQQSQLESPARSLASPPRPPTRGSRATLLHLLCQTEL